MKQKWKRLEAGEYRAEWDGGEFLIQEWCKGNWPIHATIKSGYPSGKGILYNQPTLWEAKAACQEYVNNCQKLITEN